MPTVPATRTMYEVRITPLIRGVPGLTEEDAGGLTVIDADDTVNLTQFHRLRVERPLNDGCVGSVFISMHWEDDVVGEAVAALEPLQQALWIGFWRPGESFAETIFWGQCNVKDHFGDETIELVGQDPYAGKARSHYIRRGDPALNIDSERGSLPAHAISTTDILNAARNTQPQQDRAMPALALGENYMSFFVNPSYDDAAPMEFERGQEVVSLHQTLLDAFNGPDMDCRPNWWLGSKYAYVDLYDAPGDPEAPGATQLGRNLDPADPDNPLPGDVIFDFGLGLDNVKDCDVDPGKPITHQHYLDASRDYRATVADAESSYDIGAWVGFNQADFTITRPSRTTPADKTALVELAKAIVKAYGKPPKHVTLKLRRPDLPNALLYGHPDWPSSAPGGVEVIGGVWYLGDYVRVRALKGRRSFNELARIVKVIFSQQGPNDLPEVDIELVPAVGGTPGANIDHPDPDAAPTVAITAPANGASVDDVVTITADAWDDVGVASVEFRVDGAPITGGFSVTPPWQVAWDTSTVTDGSHTLTATATDTAGNSTISATVTVTVSNSVTPPPPPPPPPPEGARLYTDGRVIRRVSDDAPESLRLVNVHTGGFSWGADHFAAMAAMGFNGMRLLVNWSRVETSPGVFSSTERNHIQTTIDRALAAGMPYVILCAGVNSPQWSQRASYVPGWAYDSDGPSSPEPGWDRPTLFSCMVSNGEAYARWLLQQFGTQVDAVDWWNEPDEDSAALVQQGMERMIGWGRSEPNGAGKAWLVTNRYSSQSAENAFNSWGSHDWSHGDLWLQPHSYFAPTAPDQTGWSSSNGMRSGSFWNGSPEANTYSTVNKQAMRNHLARWKWISQERNAPVVLGELGVQYWKTTATQRDDWMRDMVEAARLEEFAGVAGWIYGNDSDDWALRRGGVWRPEALRIPAFTTILS